MAYEVGTVADADVSAARTVALGGNYRIYISPDNVKRIGTIKTNTDVAAATALADTLTEATLTFEGGFSLSDKGFHHDEITDTPDYVVGVVSNYFTVAASDVAASNPKITLEYYNKANPSVVIADVGTPSVEFEHEDIGEHKDVKFFQKGYSRDLVLGTAPDASNDDKTVTTIAFKKDAGSNVFAKGAELGIYEMPDLSSFKLIVQTDSFANPSTQHNPISVPAGLNSSYWTTVGMTPDPEITFTQKFVSNSEIVQRLSGRHVTLMVEILKNNAVLSSRVVFTEATLNWSQDSGEGEAPVMRNSTARFKDALYFFTGS